MSTPINTGGPAFPVMYCSEGMTLRDYFAGQALASLLVNRKFNEASTKDIVERAFWFADAMLDERMEEPK
jgi:hypothetical protein